MPDLGCWGGDIVPEDKDGYKGHSAILKCECGARGFHTKNIGYIGARTIYDFAGGCTWMEEQMKSASSCRCEGALDVDDELMAHVKGCKICLEYGL